MLGMVFTEFIELVEEKFSPEVADAMLTEAGAPHGGAYTAVGYYPFDEMAGMVGILARRTGVAADELLRQFGHHLLGRFSQGHGALFARHAGLFDFVASIDGGIHVEVRKLYDRATLPRFSVLGGDDRTMRLLYQSPRGLDALAQGLLEASAAHFGDPCRITSEPYDGPEGPGTVFLLERQAA